MNWKEIFAILESKTDGKVYRAGGSVEFDELPEPGEDHLGYVYNVTDAFTTTADFVEGAGISYPAGTNVIIVDVGTEAAPVYKYDVLSGLYEVDDQMSDVSENPVQNKVVKAAIEEAAEGEEITTTDTGTDLTLSTSSGSINALTVYGKSEVVDGSIKSAGEGWATVDLGTPNWTYGGNGEFYSNSISAIKVPELNAKTILCSKYNTVPTATTTSQLVNMDIMLGRNQRIYIKDTNYTDATAFTTAMQGILLAYQLADPTQGNAIAVKTDNGTGIDGTMAVFETGTPLYGVSDTVRDVMMWDGSAGTVEKNCAKGRLADLSWISGRTGGFAADISNSKIGQLALICTRYPYNSSINFGWGFFDEYPDKTIYRNDNNTTLYVKDADYTTLTDFVASLSDAELVYELATPTTQPLTSTENASIAGLRTFAPTTHAQNNAETDMTVEAYAGTANGRAVNELEQDVQSEISALKITQSDTLALTTSGWSNNTQTIAFAHDTAKRNVIDVDPSSVEEWASCGILATAETASGITFSCKTAPTNALGFRVTSMGVN